MIFDPTEATPQQRMLAITVLAAIIETLKPSLGKPMEEVLELVRGLADKFLAGATAEVTHEDVRKHVEAHLLALKKHDEEIDSKLKEMLSKR